MKRLSSILALLLVSQVSFAAEEARHEIEGNTNANLSFAKGADTAFQLDAGYSHLYYDWIQATALVSFLTGGGTTTWDLVVGPTFNYSLNGEKGIGNAFYLTTAGGISWTNFGGSSQATFAYHLEIGKRFEIVEHVAWKPGFVMSGTTASGANPQFRVVPIQFSFHF